MPVDAIHMSVFEDSFAQARLPASCTDAPSRELGRLGCIVIDFAYFDRFPVGVMRYLLRLPTAVSDWGDALHHGDPSRIAYALLCRSRALCEHTETRAAGLRVQALALGFVSHLAVDAAVHPFVNRQARIRAARLGDSPLRQHSEVEKFHSVLFHEQRFGFDFMGTQALAKHIAVDTRAVTADPALRDALHAGYLAALGRAPSTALSARWAAGYAQYVWLVASPAGRLLMPERLKAEVREEVYSGAWGSFQAVYEAAVQRSVAAIEGAYAFAEQGGQSAFDRAVPQGPIDDLTPEILARAAE